MALANISDALDESIAGRINRKESIPEPSIEPSQHYVSASMRIAFKAALYMRSKELHINKTQIARIFGCDEKVVRRLLDPKYNTPLKKLEDALNKLEIEPVIEFNNILSDSDASINKKSGVVIKPSVRTNEHPTNYL